MAQKENDFESWKAENEKLRMLYSLETDPERKKVIEDEIRKRILHCTQVIKYQNKYLSCMTEPRYVAKLEGTVNQKRREENVEKIKTQRSKYQDELDSLIKTLESKKSKKNNSIFSKIFPGQKKNKGSNGEEPGQRGE